MADEKTPKPRVELSERERSAEVPPAGDAKGSGPEASADGSAFREGANRVFSWVRRTFPGHENAFWGGVCGLLAAVVFFAIGFWRTVVIVVLVVVGVALGQVLDGDSKIVDALRRLFFRNQ